MQLCFTNKERKSIKKLNKINFQGNNEVRNKTFPEVQTQEKNETTILGRSKQNQKMYTPIPSYQIYYTITIKKTHI